MKYFSILFIGFFIHFQGFTQTSIFNKLLQKHVSKEGWVDYEGFKKDSYKLTQYLHSLKNNLPDESWSENKQKAFWINVYNAHTLYLILENYPLKSITAINHEGNNAWKIPFIKIGKNTYNLDFVENQILRKKFEDPRIHVGINCASISCPKLSNKAFTEENIESELNRLMVEFVNDSSKNDIRSNRIEISSIFDWFSDDFTKKSSLIDFLNQYSKITIQPAADIKYQSYDWNLNTQQNIH